MKRLFLLSVICLIINCLSAQKPLSLASSFYNTLNNYVLYNDHIEYEKLMTMCDAGFRVSDRFAQEQMDIPAPSLLLQNYLELLRDKQAKLAISDIREITLSNHRTEGAPTKTVLVNLTLSSPKTSTYKLQNVVYIRNNKIFCVGDYEVDKSGKLLTDEVNQTDKKSDKHNIHNGHEYVDLGLSVMWATCNVGASRPEEFGNYYAWGEVMPKNIYNDTLYKWYNHIDNHLTKYCNSAHWYQSNGFVDHKTILDLSDDAACKNYGERWRMPTFDEWKELVQNCTFMRITINHIEGFKVTSKHNRNSIFLPAAGYIKGTEKINRNKVGYYWTRSFDLSDDYKYNSVRFELTNWKWSYRHFTRSYGLSIRPVYSPQ